MNQLGYICRTRPNTITCVHIRRRGHLVRARFLLPDSINKKLRITCKNDFVNDNIIGVIGEIFFFL